MKLPKYIIIILHKDLIEEAARPCDFGIKLKLYRMITYIMDEFERLTEIRKEDLKSKRRGAVSSSAEPRFIWCTVIPRPHNTEYNRQKIFKLVGKTNEVLEDLVERRCRHGHLLYVDNINQYMHFDRCGSLTPGGRMQLWQQIDSQMKKLDRGEIDLKPKKTTHMPKTTVGNRIQHYN